MNSSLSIVLLFLVAGSIPSLVESFASISKPKDTARNSFDDHTFSIHNFAPVSPYDQILHVAERPGNPKDKKEPIPVEKVADWSSFMKEKGITHITALLDENELANYPEPGLLNLYAQHGFTARRLAMQEEGSAKRVFEWIDDCEKAGGKMVVHCTGGVGRCGRVAAGWLVHKHGLSPEEATNAVVENAKKLNVNRKGDAEALREWLKLSKLAP